MLNLVTLGCVFTLHYLLKHASWTAFLPSMNKNQMFDCDVFPTRCIVQKALTEMSQGLTVLGDQIHKGRGELCLVLVVLL